MCERTWVSYRWVQEVHPRRGEAQPVDCVRGLLQIRHHANVRLGVEVGENLESG